MRALVATAGLGLIGSMLVLSPGGYAGAMAAADCQIDTDQVLSPVSPNGDGKKDLLDISVRSTCGATYRWSVTGVDGVEVVSVRDLDSPDLETDVVSLDLLEAAGRVLPSGSYLLNVESTVAKGTPAESVTTEALDFVVDNEADPVKSVRLTTSDVFPFPDDYLDSTDIFVEQDARYQLGVDVLDSAGTSVSKAGEIPGGVVRHFRWWGRDFPGWALRPGTYTLRVTQTDGAGNTAFAYRPVRVSDKQLVQRVWRKTYTAKNTLLKDQSRGCATLRTPARPGWRGSIRYDGTCRRPAKPVGLHRVALPRLAPIPGYPQRYKTVGVSVLGGRAIRPRGNDTTVEMLPRPRHKQSRLAGAYRWHVLPATSARSSLDKQRRLRWVVSTGARRDFDVRSFRVRASYWALQKPR